MAVSVPRRWRGRALEGDLVVETSPIPDAISLELDPIFQMAPLTKAGRAMILRDDFRPETPGYAQAWSVRREAPLVDFELCGIVIRHCQVRPGTKLSTSECRLFIGGEIEVLPPANIERHTCRMTVLTGDAVLSLRGKSLVHAWWHLRWMLAAEQIPKPTKIHRDDLAAFADIVI
jgi:hypothetical protein